MKTITKNGKKIAIKKAYITQVIIKKSQKKL